MKYFFLFCCSMLVFACAEDNSTQNEALPNTPETVVRQYQAYLDINEFELAKKLSTAKEKERLDEIAPIILEEPSDSTVFTTKFVSIACKEEGKRAMCACVIENFDNRFSDSFVLSLENGQWLVDASDEDINYDYNEEVERFIQEELEKENE